VTMTDRPETPPSRFRRRPLARFAAAATPLFLGCVLAGCDPVTAAAPAIGAANAANGVYRKGKFTSSHFARYDDVVAAARSTAAELGLNVRYEQPEKRGILLRYLDDMNHRVDITIRSRTEVVTWVEINVGAFGKPSFGQLVLDQLTDTLAEMDAYLDRRDPGAAFALPPG